MGAAHFSSASSSENVLLRGSKSRRFIETAEEIVWSFARKSFLLAWFIWPGNGCAAPSGAVTLTRICSVIAGPNQLPLCVRPPRELIQKHAGRGPRLLQPGTEYSPKYDFQLIRTWYLSPVQNSRRYLQNPGVYVSTANFVLYENQIARM